MESTIKVGTKLENKTSPQWGIWTVQEIHSYGYEIRNYRGTKVICKSEIKYWNVID